jgi:hypothetical protein
MNRPPTVFRTSGLLNPAAAPSMSHNSHLRHHGVAPEATSIVLYLVVLALVLFVALN